MALTSASTRDTVLAQLVDNCAYDVNDSTSEARLFIEAARHWQIKYLPQSTTVGGNSITTNHEALAEALKKAVEWLAANDEDAASAVPAGVVRHADLSCFRG